MAKPVYVPIFVRSLILFLARDIVANKHTFQQHNIHYEGPVGKPGQAASGTPTTPLSHMKHTIYLSSVEKFLSLLEIIYCSS